MAGRGETEDLVLRVVGVVMVVILDGVVMVEVCLFCRREDMFVLAQMQRLIFRRAIVDWELGAHIVLVMKDQLEKADTTELRVSGVGRVAHIMAPVVMVDMAVREELVAMADSAVMVARAEMAGMVRLDV